MARTTPLRPLPLLALTLGTACATSGSEGGNDGASLVRDSAGIQIVENSAPRWASDETWQLADPPLLEMGVMEGDPDHEFYQVRGVVRLANGTVVVANAGTHELRYYDPSGALVAKGGRKGGGPGEFEGLSGLHQLAGDTVGALDLRHRRLSLYDAEGGFVRDVTLGQSDNMFSFSLLTGVLDDGSFVGNSPNVRMGPEMFTRPTGPARDTVVLVHYAANGAASDTIGRFPGGRVNVKQVNMGPQSMPIGIPIGFSPQAAVTAGGASVFVGISETYEIGEYTAAGELRRLIRRRVSSRAVTEADKDTLRAQLSERSAGLPASAPAAMRQAMKEMLDAMANPEFADSLPAFSRLLVDRVGNLWVFGYRVGTGADQEAAVFDRDRHFLGTVHIPANLAVTEIGDDYVAGFVTDETEIQHVLVYELKKAT